MFKIWFTIIVFVLIVWIHERLNGRPSPIPLSQFFPLNRQTVVCSHVIFVVTSSFSVFSTDGSKVVVSRWLTVTVTCYWASNVTSPWLEKMIYHPGWRVSQDSWLRNELLQLLWSRVSNSKPNRSRSNVVVPIDNIVTVTIIMSDKEKKVLMMNETTSNYSHLISIKFVIS